MDEEIKLRLIAIRQAARRLLAIPEELRPIKVDTCFLESALRFTTCIAERENEEVPERYVIHTQGLEK